MNETALTETAYRTSDALWPSLHSPQWLWLLPLVLAAFGLLLLVARRGRRQALATFAAPRLLGTLLASVSQTRRILKSVLVLLGAALIVLAIARPQYGFRWSESRSRGIDIVFVLDTSRSMLATDIKPDRLQRAKLAILDFVDQLDGDRIGLVAFAGDAFVQCPLTLDYNVFEQSLEAINTDTIPIGGTDFSKAITVAEDAFAKDNNHKILIMLTDGEDLEGQGLKRAREAAKNGVTIFTVGVGTAEGSLIPVTDRFGRRDFLRDQSGQQVMTRLESDTLNDIAEVTGGFYVPLGSAGQGLETVYRDGLQTFEKQELSSQMKREGIDRFQWPLALGILLLAWEPLISNRKAAARRALSLFRRKRSSAPASGHSTGTATALATLLLPALFAAAALTPASTHAASARSAESLFSKGDFAAASEAFTQLLDAEPANTRARYNLGNALLAQKQYEEAAKTYAQVLADADIALQSDIFYNLGLAHYGRGTQAFEGSDPAQTQAQSEQARGASAQATQAGQQLLNEAARIQALDARQQSTPVRAPLQVPGSSPLPQENSQTQLPEIPQEAVQQAIQLAEQAKQASESALESGETFIEKAQAASGFWRRAQADFNSAAELSAGNAADARHNAEQTQKSVDALSARISQTQRANRTHEADAQSLEKLIEELKKLLKEPPQNDQNQDQQNQQDNQQNQEQQNQDQQNQDQQNQDQQSDQNQSGQQDQQNDQQSGDQSQQDQQQSGQDSQPNQSQNSEQNQDSQGEKNQQDNQQQSQGNEGDNQPEQSPDSSESGQQDQNKQQDGQQKPDEQKGDSQSERPDGQQQGNESPQQQGTDESQQQQGGERQQGATPEEQDGREQNGGQTVDLTDEQREQMAAGEQPAQDQSTGTPAEAAPQRAGAMSQQEAAGLLESLNNSGKLLPLSGRGQQQQQTRPSRDW